MNHPFNLRLEDLEVLELDCLPADEAAIVGGQTIATTLAVGEEGGHEPIPLPRPVPPFPKPICPPHRPPIYTTLALGEEGGDATM